jgi:MoaA/NifB/PqqE/SkfB family radical SAM enzyme
MFNFNELKSVHLEISTRCQASCPMCPRNYHGGQENPNLKLADWSYLDFVKVFDHDTLAQLEGIYFCGNFGDPIMNDDLIPMCRHIKENAPHIVVRVHTNGGARKASWWQELRDSLPENHVVLFALDGLKDTHHLYRIGTKYETVIKNAQSFIEAGGIAEWVFIKFKHNEHQVDEAERRSKELGFQRFAVKNTVRFIGENKFSVLDKEGNVLYYLEPPTTSHVVLLDKSAIEKFRSEYKEADVNCYVVSTKEIYIDAHRNLFPCCFLASAPYNNPQSQPIVADIRKEIVDQYYELVESLGGIEQLDATKRSVKEIISDDRWQSVWKEYWGEKMLITCARTCGTTKNINFSKPKDQFVKRVSNDNK